MSTASTRAAARATFLEALADADLQPELRARAASSRAEAERLEAYGAEVKAGRDALADAQEAAAAAAVEARLVAALGSATVGDTGIGLRAVAQRREEAERRAELEAELTSLSAGRGLVARARTKARRMKLEGQLRGMDPGGDEALGRLLVAEGRLLEVRTPRTASAIDALVAVLPADVAELGAVRAEWQRRLELPSPPTALDLRPLLSRTRASEGAAREAADGAETEAIEAALAHRSELPPGIAALADALLKARAAEHESQRVQLEAQLAAVDGEVD